MPGSGIAHLREEAARCRRLARSTLSDDVAAVLKSLADEYDAQADQIEAASMDGAPHLVIRPTQQ
jgi:hypothetical protein